MSAPPIFPALPDDDLAEHLWDLYSRGAIQSISTSSSFTHGSEESHIYVCLLPDGTTLSGTGKSDSEALRKMVANLPVALLPKMDANNEWIMELAGFMIDGVITSFGVPSQDYPYDLPANLAANGYSNDPATLWWAILTDGGLLVATTARALLNGVENPPEAG